MDADTAKKLRAPFPAEIVGKLPRIICPKCRDARSKACDEHPKSKCRDCDNFITPRHIHLDYVGHAAITDRLLQADPAWTWEPVAFGPDGLPLTDKNGGLWIRLTVAGVTRLGFGDAMGKQGPDAVKEAIGDALRNAAMRFGVALDLWHKDGQLLQDDEPAAAPASVPPQQRRPEAVQESGADAARKRLRATCAENGWNWGTVSAIYKTNKKTALDEATDVASITKFREYLFSLPQAALMPATNGVAA